MESGNIQIGDYQFEKYIAKEQIESKIATIADAINAFYGSQKVQVMILLEGAEIFASKLIPQLKFPVLRIGLQLKTYESLISTKSLHIPPDLANQLNEKDPILIVEDIIDSGHTLSTLLNFLDARGFHNKQIVSLLLKPECLKHPIQPLFLGFEIGPEFVIGFGMDIDENGRDLDSIYKLKTQLEL